MPALWLERTGLVLALPEVEPSYAVEPTPTPEPEVMAASAPEPTVAKSATVQPAPVYAAGQLSEGEMRDVLAAAGWPAELHDAALRVAWCESKYSPGARGDHGASVGLFQLNLATWFRYAGEDPAQWDDPVVNARVAWATYNYDVGRGSPPWKQWSCKP